MELKLFDVRQVLLFVGSVSIGNEVEVCKLIKELGFSSSVRISGIKAMETKNLYSGYFEGNEEGDVLEVIKEQIYIGCKNIGIGLFDFFLIDSTDAPMFKSIWHDGFY
jgi:hypothetical protein